MRKIKFRAWDKLDKKMHRVCRLGMSGFSHNFWSPSPVACDSRTNCDQYVIMQFTGLLDRAGREIYEGDIVKAVFNGTDVDVGIRGVVKWEDSFVGYAIVDKGWNYRISATAAGQRKVIGNIYETPELLT